MDDTISRQAAIDIAQKLIITLDGYEMHNQAVANYCVEITQLPPAQPEPHWIPVTERLPNRDELVLVTYKTTSKIHLCKYLDDGSENSWWSYIDDCCAWNNVILAWMPLPAPWKGEVTE